MEIYTIGFTQKTAEEFFQILKRAGIRRLLDVRLRVYDNDLAAELSVTDLRLVEEDHQTPRRGGVDKMQGLIASGW